MSKQSIVKNIIEQFSNDEVPEELTYTVEPKLNYDPYKLWYTDYYKSPEYIASKLPNGWQSIPAFDKVIEEMSKNAITPLEEMNKREMEAKIKYLSDNYLNLALDNTNE
jgi:hypothetical protein